MRDFPRRLTAALLFLVLAFCIYRARTQSLVIDEAWVFQKFVNQPLAEMARSWDVCNHVLHTLLMKWFRERFGIGEIVLRIPSLIGAAVYLAAVYFLTRLLFSGWRQPVAAALLILHPFVIDFMIAARGYGLALGFYTWALYCGVSYWVRARESSWLRSAGVLAGLAVASNLTFGVPVAALGCSLFLMESLSASGLSPAESHRRVIERGWLIVDWYFGPALVIATLIVIVPLLQVQPADFYFGEPNLFDSLRRMYQTTFKSEHASFSSIGWSLSPYSGPALTVLALCISGMAAVFLWRRGYEHFVQAPFTLVGATLAITVLAHCVLGAFGVLYPSGRTGLYLIPLFTLPVILLLQHRRFAGAFGVLIVLIYVSENDPRYFAEWRYDAGTRDLLRSFADDREKRKLQPPVSVEVSAALRFTAEYYQLRRRMPWMQIEAPATSGAQYALLDPQASKEADPARYEVIAKHPLSGATLARRLP